MQTGIFWGRIGVAGTLMASILDALLGREWLGLGKQSCMNYYIRHKDARQDAFSKILLCLPDRVTGRVMASPLLIVNLHWRQCLTQTAVRTAWGQTRVRKWAILRNHTGRQILCGPQERTGVQGISKYPEGGVGGGGGGVWGSKHLVVCYGFLLLILFIPILCWNKLNKMSYL